MGGRANRRWGFSMKEDRINRLGFYGVWTPPEILMMDGLTANDRYIYSKVLALTKNKYNECDASNDYIGSMMRCSPITVSNSITKLKGFGCLEVNYQRNEHGNLRRYIRVIPFEQLPAKLLSKEAYFNAIELAKNKTFIDDPAQEKTHLKNFEEGSNPSYKNFKESLKNFYISNKRKERKKRISFSSKEENGGGENQPPPNPAENRKTLSRLEGFPGGEKEERGHDLAVMKAALLDQVPGSNGKPDHKAKELSWDGASEEARTILELWNALGCGTIHPADGPGARKALYAIDNLVLPKGYAVDRLADAVECYAVVTQGDGKRRSLTDFLVVSDYVRGLVRKKGLPAPKPLFLEFYSDNGSGTTKGEEEFKLYGELKRVYAAWTRGVKPSDAQFSLKERRNLLTAVPKLMRCKEKGWLDAFFAEPQRANYGDYINVLFRGLKRKYGTDYGTGHVASDHTWNDLFPKFIQEDYGESVLRAQKNKGR